MVDYHTKVPAFGFESSLIRAEMAEKRYVVSRKGGCRNHEIPSKAEALYKKINHEKKMSYIPVYSAYEGYKGLKRIVKDKDHEFSRFGLIRHTVSLLGVGFLWAPVDYGITRYREYQFKKQQKSEEKGIDPVGVQEHAMSSSSKDSSSGDSIGPQKDLSPPPLPSKSASSSSSSSSSSGDTIGPPKDLPPPFIPVPDGLPPPCPVVDGPLGPPPPLPKTLPPTEIP